MSAAAAEGSTDPGPHPRTDPERELFDPSIQALDPVELERRRAEGLRNTWDRMWELPFYAELWGAAGLSRADMPPLSEIPRTTKSAHRVDEAAHPPFGRHRTVGLDDARRLGVSTGTTGAPTFIFYGPRDLDAMVEIGKRNNWRLGMPRGTASRTAGRSTSTRRPRTVAARTSSWASWRSPSDRRSRRKPRPSTCACGSACAPPGS